MSAPFIAETIASLRQRLAPWRKEGQRIALVPTMGALHEGHLSLAKLARQKCDRVVTSIFVNPTQFAPHEDFDRYPRQVARDADMLGQTGAVDLIFAPPVQEMYPAGAVTRVEMTGGPAAGLESVSRPHFFGGVATIVAKLLIAAQPDQAVFGEKDYQQLLVIRRMVADLSLPVEILGAPIMRDADGLALSSRNAYLTPDQKAVAIRLNRVLAETIAQVKAGMPIATAQDKAREALLAAGFESVDYVEIRDAQTLAQIETLSGPARILVAARIGGVRLIDNMAV